MVVAASCIGATSRTHQLVADWGGSTRSSNEDFDRVYSDLAHIYHAQREKRVGNHWIGGLLAGLLN